jgi:cytochrome c oxidase subunit IV
MNKFSIIAIWIYTVIATILEALSFYYLRRFGYLLTNSVIMALGLSQVFVIAAYYMHLKYESKALVIVALSPIMVVAALITGILFSIPHH